MTITLNVFATRNGYWSIDTDHGRLLWDGFIDVMTGEIHPPVPERVEAAVRQAWISGDLVEIPYSPETAPPAAR